MMSTIRKHGAPTKSTAGSIGDLYLDLDTNRYYYCTAIYSDSMDSRKEYHWDPYAVEVNLSSGESAVRLPASDIKIEVDKEPKTEREETPKPEPVSDRPKNNYQPRNNYGKYYKSQGKPYQK